MQESVILTGFSDQMDALADAQRRRLLFALRDSSSDEDLLDRLDDRNGGSPELGFRTAMNHVHLPKLDSYGFINWDPEGNTVRRGPAFEEIEPLLDLIESHREDLLLEPDHP